MALHVKVRTGPKVCGSIISFTGIIWSKLVRDGIDMTGSTTYIIISWEQNINICTLES